MDKEYDWLVKLLLIGDSGVGKTNILLRFCDNHFFASHLATIGIDFKTKTIQIDDKRLKLQIWDTAGQQRFKTITQNYYKRAMAILMTYAVNERQTFQSLQNWLKQIKLHGNENVIKVMIGNKSDCSDREVSLLQGQQLAERYGIQYFQTSAKQNTNINQVFYHVGRQLKQRLLITDPDPVLSKIAKMECRFKRQKYKKCC